MDKEAIEKKLTNEEEQHLIRTFKQGTPESLVAYRKLRAAYRDKINLMAEQYRRRGDNIASAQMTSVAEQMFPTWLHAYNPEKKNAQGQTASFNTFLECAR